MLYVHTSTNIHKHKENNELVKSMLPRFKSVRWLFNNAIVSNGNTKITLVGLDTKSYIE